MKTRTEVFFDSSFLMTLAEHPTSWEVDLTDLLGGFNAILLDCIERELLRLSASKGESARRARVALQMAAGFERRHCGEAAPDDELMSSALSSGGWVATVDRELLGALGRTKVRTVTLRGGRVATA